MKNTIFILYIFSLVISCSEPTPPAIETSTKAPNVVLMIGDDHGYADMGFLNLADDVTTPNFDRLAKQSISFKNAYATSPICSPSRVGIMTGAYHQRQKVFWYGGNGLSNPKIPTIAEILLEKGYATGFFGKFHYGSKDTDTTHRSFPLNHGYQELFGCNGGRKHYLIHNNEKEAAFRQAMKKAADPKQSLEMGGFWVQNKRENVEGFATEMISQKGIGFMKEQLTKDQPFFATISFNAVHNFTHQLPQEYLDQHNLKGYRDWDPEKEAYYDWYNEGRMPNNPEGRAHYLGQLYYLDKEVGRIMDFLEKENQLENTLIIYVGDNGGSSQIYSNNSPYKGGKYTMYEGGLRIPLLIAWKGKYLAGKEVENMVSALDILPTICEATSTKQPKLSDGLSLQKILDGTDSKLEHETLVWYGGEQAAVRSGKWKYRWANDAKNSFAKSSTKYEGVDLELGDHLHNLKIGIPEEENLKNQESEVLVKLQDELSKWKTMVGIDPLKD